MSTPETTVADLVPLADRVRWMLASRLSVVALLPIAAALGILSGPPPGTLLCAGLAWSALTLLTLPTKRLGRRLAIAAFTASLFGDGLLLGVLRASSGWLGGPIEIIVVAHVVAVTLLASFRTGAKIATWHLLVCFLLLESRAVGLLGPAVPIELDRFAVTMTLMWLVMIATASFAAVNERELRRRRYDTERLHAFGAAAALRVQTGDVVALLALFARDELLASRVAVLLYPGPAGSGRLGSAHVLNPDGAHEMAVAAGPGRRSVLREASTSGLTVIAGPSTTRHEPILADLLPGARSVIVVPFGTGETAGALILEHPRRSSQRGSRRVELRMIDTAEQAAGQAALAIGRAQLLAQARQAAQTDGLTRLANRRAFDQRLAEQTAHATAGGPPVTLVMIDLDHFKRLNDNHGHQAGDEVLRLVAQVLRDNAPAGSMPARYGGEELALILSGTGPAEGVEVAERIRAAIATAPGPVPVTASLGVAWCPGTGTSPHELLAAADAALYEAKRGGRNRVVPAWTDAHAI